MESPAAILWDFVDLSLCSAAPLIRSRMVTAFISVNYVPILWKSHRWHEGCSSIPYLKDWLPGVAGTDPRLGYRFWGVNYEKGGLHQPPFSFSGLHQGIAFRLATAKYWKV
jgi:hypothetical protein